MTFFSEIGNYSVFLAKVFNKPERKRILFKEFKEELIKLGINSIPIVIIISLFIGAVITIQTAYNMKARLVPLYLIGYLVRESMILEFSSTIVSLILAGKIGSNIASEIGSMRISEQIDALEIMGVNSASYLALPKILAAMLFNPILYVFSVFIGVFGGIMAGSLGGLISVSSFIEGLQFHVHLYYIVYSMIKTVFFGFIITSIAAFYGYNVSGGALNVGKASTKAVVNSSVAILLMNLILTQLILN